MDTTGQPQDMSTGAKVGLGIAAGLAAGAIAWVVMSATEGHGAQRASVPALPAGRGPGWYTLMYNYPPRHHSRRVKSFAGPYATKAEAQATARIERDVWYPVVRHLSNDPWHLREFSSRRRRRS